MAEFESLSKIEKIDLPTLVASLKAESDRDSTEAGLKLVKQAAKFGLNMRDYLTLAVEPDDKLELNGYQRTLNALNLPVKDNFQDGVFLQAAGDTFQTHAGTRALFPEVIDDVLRFAVRQDQFESTEPMIANSRTVTGAELLSTVVDDDSKQNDSFSVPEGARIPVRSIKTSESTVKMYKHGSGIRTTYEFGRRASLEILIPHVNRIARELEISKVRVATSILINGDGAYGAAPVVRQKADYDTPVNASATAGELSWQHILYWLVQRAKAGTPIDTIAMNWDGYFQWIRLFAKPTADAGNTPAENLASVGADVQTGLNVLNVIKPVISSSVPAGKLVGYTKGDTVEEIVEAGSNIQESERAISNQTVTSYKTENTGYHLVYGDTRSVYDFSQ